MRLGKGFGCWERENGRGEQRKVDIERVSVSVRMMWWPSFGQVCVWFGGSHLTSLNRIVPNMRQEERIPHSIVQIT